MIEGKIKTSHSINNIKNYIQQTWLTKIQKTIFCALERDEHNREAAEGKAKP